jgi:hypothetical protein
MNNSVKILNSALYQCNEVKNWILKKKEFYAIAAKWVSWDGSLIEFLPSAFNSKGVDLFLILILNNALIWIKSSNYYILHFLIIPINY